MYDGKAGTLNVCYKHVELGWKTLGNAAISGKEMWEMPKGSFHSITSYLIYCFTLYLK